MKSFRRIPHQDPINFGPWWLWPVSGPFVAFQFATMDLPCLLFGCRPYNSAAKVTWCERCICTLEAKL